MNLKMYLPLVVAALMSIPFYVKGEHPREEMDAGTDSGTTVKEEVDAGTALCLYAVDTPEGDCETVWEPCWDGGSP